MMFIYTYYFVFLGLFVITYIEKYFAVSNIAQKCPFISGLPVILSTTFQSLFFFTTFGCVFYYEVHEYYGNITSKRYATQ